MIYHPGYFVHQWNVTLREAFIFSYVSWFKKVVSCLFRRGVLLFHLSFLFPCLIFCCQKRAELRLRLADLIGIPSVPVAPEQLLLCRSCSDESCSDHRVVSCFLPTGSMEGSHLPRRRFYCLLPGSFCHCGRLYSAIRVRASRGHLEQAHNRLQVHQARTATGPIGQPALILRYRYIHSPTENDMGVAHEHEEAHWSRPHLWSWSAVSYWPTLSVLTSIDVNARARLPR